MVLWYLPLLLYVLQKLNLLLKQGRRKCCSKTSSTGKFRSSCSRDWEALGSSEAIAHQFTLKYLYAASANFSEYRVLVMLCLFVIPCRRGAQTHRQPDGHCDL